MSSVESHHLEEVFGEDPGIGVPGEINLGDTPKFITKEQLQNAADNFLEERPHLTNAIIRHGKDAIAMATSRGPKLYIGVGVASLAVAGGVIIWRHLHPKD